MNIRREQLDQGQYPDCWDFAPPSGNPTYIQPKSQFRLKVTELYFSDEWRLTLDSGVMKMQYWDGANWDTIEEWSGT